MEIIRPLLLIPFLLLTAFLDITTKPNRVFKGSGQVVEQPAGHWEKAPPLPSNRYDFGANALGDKIFVVGGLFLPDVWFPTSRVDVYDAKTKEWTRIKDYPRLIHHPGVIGCAGNLYVVGGFWIRIVPSERVYMYDAKANDWVRKADLPFARGSVGVACVDNKIYAVGGSHDDEQYSRLDVYDPAKDTWKSLTPMPTAREHLAIAATGGKIYVLGGYEKDRYHALTINEAYDPKTDTWQKLASMPHAVNGFSAAAIGNSIFFFGGGRGDAVSGEVHEYKIDENRWVRKVDLPVAKYAATSATMSDGIHVIGGNSVVRGNYFNLDHDIFIP